MFTSSRLSFLSLRLGLVAVFLWFGIDKFIHPLYWLNAWVPAKVVGLSGQVGVSGAQFVYLNGIFELLVAVAVLFNVGLKFFSALAALFLVAVVSTVGISEVTVRDFGLIGGFISLFFWPARMTSSGWPERRTRL